MERIIKTLENLDGGALSATTATYKRYILTRFNVDVETTEYRLVWFGRMPEVDVAEFDVAFHVADLVSAFIPRVNHWRAVEESLELRGSAARFADIGCKGEDATS